MKHLLLSGFFVIIGLSVFAQTQPGYDGIQAIKEIHDGWLIVRLPGFKKKLAVLDSLLERETLSASGRKNIEREKRITLKEQLLIHEWYPIVFDNVYKFSRHAFIYTHETAGFQSGTLPAWSVNGTPIDSLHLTNYFFATLHGVVGAPFRFTSKDNQIVLYPFPNNIAKPGSVAIMLFTPVLPLWAASFVVDDSSKKRAYRHVVRLNRKLSSFYSRKYEKGFE